jgi:hypothetical protein
LGELIGIWPDGAFAPSGTFENHLAGTMLPDGGRVESYVSDLSRMADVEALAKAVAERHGKRRTNVSAALHPVYERVKAKRDFMHGP